MGESLPGGITGVFPDNIPELHVYAEIAKEPDLDALLQLGDYIYIYEYDNRGYATEDAERLVRTGPDDNDVDLVSRSCSGA